MLSIFSVIMIGFLCNCYQCSLWMLSIFSVIVISVLCDCCQFSQWLLSVSLWLLSVFSLIVVNFLCDCYQFFFLSVFEQGGGRVTMDADVCGHGQLYQPCHCDSHRHSPEGSWCCRLPSVFDCKGLCGSVAGCVSVWPCCLCCSLLFVSCSVLVLSWSCSVGVSSSFFFASVSCVSDLCMLLVCGILVFLSVPVILVVLICVYVV